MTDVPHLSRGDGEVIEIDSSTYENKKSKDPRIFTTISLSNSPRATSHSDPNPSPNVQARALVDCGSTHEVLGTQFADRTGLPVTALLTTGDVYGFDGQPRSVAHDAKLFIDEDQESTRFLVTKIKDAYNVILGMPWLQKNGHRINWKDGSLQPKNTTSPPIGDTAAIASSMPTTTPNRPCAVEGKARNIDKAALTEDHISENKPPQCEYDTKNSLILVSDDKLLHPRDNYNQTSDEPHDLTKSLNETKTTLKTHTIKALPLAADQTVSPTPKNTPDRLYAVEGNARNLGEGALIDSHIDEIKPPQCEYDTEKSRLVETDDKLLHPRNNFEQDLPMNDLRPVATTPVVLPSPKNTPDQLNAEEGKARNLGKGAHTEGLISVIQPPQCEHATVLNPSFVTDNKLLHPLNSYEPEICAVAPSWNISAKLAAEAGKDTIEKSAEELMPTRYHCYINMFRKQNAMTLPPHRRYDFWVDLIPGATPQAAKIIPLSPAEEKALDTMIDEGLEKGTIRRTKSPWAAPVLFTGKKDGNLRPCFDYQRLNALTVKNRYPLPLTMELVDSLRNAERYTSLDMRNGYNNLRVKEVDELKLAFICKRGQFKPLVMPFGPTGAPGYFQFFISDIFRDKIGKDLAAYLDDLLIYTPAGVDHEQVVEEVLKTLAGHSIWLKPEKCRFSQREIAYLGLLISKNQVPMDPVKVSAVKDWPAPKNVTQTQRFLGFANFYRRFISNFSKITRPLHELTQDDVKFDWTPKRDEAFEILKQAFTTAPVLKIADPYKAFVLKCDFSDFALGAVLSQEH